MHAVDVFGTVADILEVDGSTGEDTVSLMPLLQDAEGPVREFVYSEYFTAQSGAAAYREGHRKLLVWGHGERDNACRGRTELYDRVGDRWEQDDLAVTDPDGLAAMIEGLESLIDSAEHHWLDVPDC